MGQSTAAAPVISAARISLTDPIEVIVGTIMDNLKFPSMAPELQPRLENAVRLRLKDIRDTVDTRDALRRSPEEGGVGLSDESADLVIQTIIETLPKLHEEGGAARADATTRPAASGSQTGIIEKPPSQLFTPSEPDINKKESLTPQKEATSPSATRVQPTTPASSILSTASKTVPPPPSVEKLSSSQTRPLDATGASTSAISSVLAGAKTPSQSAEPPLISRPSMVDVRSRPPVVGPIDELRLFSIVDFRRLDPDPKRAAARLKEKIRLLEDESYDKMVEGVHAWRSSPLYYLYLTIGHDGLTKDKHLKEVLQERQAKGGETLTEEEFEAIVALNKSLRF